MTHFVPAVIRPDSPTATAYRFAFVDGCLLLREGEETALPLLPAADCEAEDRHNLGHLDGHDCWAVALPSEPSGWRSSGLRAALMAMPSPQMAVAARAAQVLEWDRTHRFCGICGAPTERSVTERARVCAACQHTSYPRISPVMMALVWRDGELLLARSPRFTAGVYSALAGFVEAGESLEECVAREIAEEVGVKVTDLRYYGSQSWPFPHSLMLAFTARWTGGEIVPQEGEIEHAAWFKLDALPNIPPRFSISGHLIRDTVAALQAGIDLSACSVLRREG